MSRYRKITTICCAAVFALGLAACGGGGGGGPATEPPPDPAIAERAAIASAIDAAEMKVAAVDNDSTDADVSAADAAVAAATGAIAAATAVPAEEKAANTRAVTAIANQLTSAKNARKTAMDDAADAANKAMVALASKLYSALSKPPGGSGGDTRNAAYAGANDSEIAVTIGTADAVNLKEDKKTTVAAHHGWQGKRYMAEPDGGGTYEAMVYSNVGESTEGAKFSATYPYNATPDADNNNTELSIDTSTSAVQARIASSSFNQNAGTKEFKKGDNETRVILSGSYHGVSGDYYCTPSTTCSASVADKGFTLGGGTWTFKATNKDAKLMDTPDPNYASYGWWIHTSADGKTVIASAFADEKGQAPDELNLTNLRGTAKYMGGAVGKYAISNPTGLRTTPATSPQTSSSTRPSLPLIRSRAPSTTSWVRTARHETGPSS